ncbi:MAG: transcription elongation factor GreA [Bacteroidota bacterium]|nr:transcription elongation factor GreA [Bacteroidota bacterium]
MEFIYLSQEGYDQLKKDLNKLKLEERPKIINQIAEARDKGDLSENAEYDAAKEAQGLLEARIAKIELELSKSRVIKNTNLDNSSIHLLSTVTIQNIDNNMEMTYTIVSAAEADITKKKISSTSPIGKGLLGKSIDDIVEIEVPSGITKFKILNIN